MVSHTDCSGQGTTDSPCAESEVNRATTEEVQRYLQRERPDFVVHNGDVIRYAVLTLRDEASLIE